MKPPATRAATSSVAAMAIALAVVGAAAGCWRDVRLLPAGDAGKPASSDGAGVDGANAHDATPLPACTGLGEPARLPTAAGPACAGALAARGHRFVLCACDAMTAAARIRSEAFDSRDPAVQDEVAAAVGVNGMLQSTAEVRAGGALYVAGAGGLRASDHVQTSRSLRVGGPVAMLSSRADVGGDAFVAGDISGSVRVDGALHVSAAAAVGTGAQAASVVREPVAVAPPCDCSAGFADIAAAVASAAAANHDAAAGISPAALADASAPARLDLPCGVYHLTSVDAAAGVTLAVHGRALLAVSGDVALRGGLAVELDAGAELDLLVAGRLTASGGGTLGAPAAPARVRIWVAGTSSVVLDDQPSLGAVLRAPRAPLSAPAGLSLQGAVLAASVSIGADSTLRFDRAILAAGAACGEPEAEVVP